VGMDMSHAFRAEVQMHCPQAEIVYDLFHVVAKYGKEVVDAIRVAEANRIRHDRAGRKLIKGAKVSIHPPGHGLSIAFAVREISACTLLTFRPDSGRWNLIRC